MGRGNDPFWKYASKLNPGFKCNYCGGRYAGSITRFKRHLAKIEGHDVNVCPAVPKDVQQEAYQAIGDPQSYYQGIRGPNRKRKTMSSLPNNNAAFTIPTSSGRQYNVAVAENQVTDVEMTLRELVQTPEQEIGEGTTIALPGVGSEMENNAGGLVPPVNTLGDTLLTREVVGENFEEHIEDIWSWLMNDVLRIGIYGMGGVGKTELAKHLNNKLLQDPNKFHHVYWVNVSPNCSIHKLQNSIAKAAGINLSSEDDENKRAARLSKELTQNKRSILIFDDVWDYISLQDVGIPIHMNGCNLILTTRSFEVCRQTNCQKTIKMETLSGIEGWRLFEKEVGDKMTLSNDVEEIAKSVVSELEGLPLGIRTMARYMRGVVNIQQWRNALKGRIQRQVSEEIFRKLKLSYDYLKDPALQQCFLYCALFEVVEDEHDGWIAKEDLIQYLIDEGIIKRMNSRREEFDEGHTMLNILENVCLLNGDRYLTPMHHLIRSMALQIMKESSGVRAMIEFGKGLEELPEEGIWTGDLVRVSLHHNYIKEIASNHSPRCPNLSTLLLHGNFELRRIADSFFKHLHGLKVLDLSNTGIQNLPNSVTTLVNLASLAVGGCRKLTRLPSLANLRELKRLDLGFSGVEEVPDGLEFLSKLMYLDLRGTSVKEIRRGILPKLSHLQFLKLPLKLAVEGEEVASLSKVETLYCRFHDLVGFNTFVESMEELMIGSECELLIGPSSQKMSDRFFLRSGIGWNYEVDKYVVANNCSIGKEGNFLNFPADLQGLAIVECNDAQSLHCVHPLIYATQLEYVSIRKCNGMECLFLLPEDGWRIFPRLKFLNLDSLENFRFLFGREVAVAPPLPCYGNSFNQLSTFEMINCPTIKKLFPPRLLASLQNLKEINVRDCSSMEEIIGAERQEEEETMDFSLPKLLIFNLRNLPQLKSICDRAVICESLRLIRLIDCPGQMMDVPFFYPSGHQSFDRVEISRN
ncbi:hypothetical protein P3X46_006780 [Hevea brasiliensis]|uniref:BED-type domain-containing protein n=1 Tax=Hevea brasiliensis TaxID=3981 RepID=A0ABQ9MV71_HEVBR|nr:probable disease resistance protein At4g27220 [Hevea brasiliensis]KAJ9182830.1 hypothetical protein P3X46_006780 [Hevea brasiliensis]